MGETVVTHESSNESFFAENLTKRQKVTIGKRWLLAFAILSAAIAVGTQVWRSVPVAAELQPVATLEVLPVTTMAAKRVESYARQRHYTGLLREARRSQLSFQRGGELLELLVDEGEGVVAGQVLGRLDARHIRARRAQLEAQVGEAKALLDELLAGPRQETIAAKRAELQAQESQRRVLAGQLKRRKVLVESATVSREEYETFLYDYQAAVARVDVVRRQLDELLAGTRIEKIVAQRARLAQLDAQLTDIVHDVEDTTLVAPFAGRISQRLVDEGTVIAASMPVLEVIDDTRLEAWIGLPSSAASSLQVEDKRELLIDGETQSAVVQSLAPDVQQSTRTRNVILSLQPSKKRFFPGQVVRLAVTEKVAQAGYWVPTTALTRGTRGLWSVFVVEEGVVARRDVEMLDTVGGESFVRGTLQPEDEIIRSGTHRVVVGQRVAVQRKQLAQRPQE